MAVALRTKWVRCPKDSVWSPRTLAKSPQTGQKQVGVISAVEQCMAVSLGEYQEVRHVLLTVAGCTQFFCRSVTTGATLSFFRRRMDEDLLESLEQCKDGLLESFKAIIELAKGASGTPEQCKIGLASQLAVLIDATADQEDVEECEDLLDAVEKIKSSGRKLMQCLLTFETGGRDNIKTPTQEMGQDLKAFVTAIEKLRSTNEKEAAEVEQEAKEVDLKGLVALNNEVRTVLVKLNADYRDMLKPDCDAGWTQLRDLIKKIVQLGENAKIPVVCLTPKLPLT